MNRLRKRFSFDRGPTQRSHNIIFWVLKSRAVFKVVLKACFTVCLVNDRGLRDSFFFKETIGKSVEV